MGNKNMVATMLGNLGLEEELVESAYDKQERRRESYIKAQSEDRRTFLYAELNKDNTRLEQNIRALVHQIPTILKLTSNVEMQADQIRVATRKFFKEIHFDFDNSAAASVGQLVANSIKSVSNNEIAIHREGSYKHVLNIVMDKIENQGEQGYRVSKSKFIRGLRTNPDKLRDFEGYLEEYVGFRWTLSMMTEGSFSNSLLDDYKENKEGVVLTLNR